MKYSSKTNHLAVSSVWLLVSSYLNNGPAQVNCMPGTKILGPSVVQTQTDPPQLPQDTNRGGSQNNIRNGNPYPERNGDRYSPSMNQPDQNRQRYPDRNSGDRYGSVTGDRYQQYPGGRDRYPDRNGDRFQPEKNRDRNPGGISSSNGDGGRPEITCNRCSQCASGYCKPSSNECCLGYYFP